MRHFLIVRPECGDWEALYMDGKLIAEGHSLRANDVLDAISSVFQNEVKYIEISDEEAECGMPMYSKDLSFFK